VLPWIPLGGKVYYLWQNLGRLVLLLRRRGMPTGKTQLIQPFKKRLPPAMGKNGICEAPLPN